MKYFTMHEMTLSATALQRHIDNSPTPEAKRNLVQLVEAVLDPARERLGFPVVVTSGYRCPKLNKAVGGSPRSQHLKGEAADLISINNAALGVIIAQRLPFDQLIFENRTSDDTLACEWVHVSYSATHNRREILSKSKSGQWEVVTPDTIARESARIGGI